MLAFPIMLVEAAKRAGFTVPKDPDNFLAEDFPHFHLFCCAQLGRSMSSGAHWENAKVIASVPLDQVKTITTEGLEEAGWIY